MAWLLVRGHYDISGLYHVDCATSRASRQVPFIASNPDSLPLQTCWRCKASPKEQVFGRLEGPGRVEFVRLKGHLRDGHGRQDLLELVAIFLEVLNGSAARHLRHEVQHEVQREAGGAPMQSEASVGLGRQAWLPRVWDNLDSILNTQNPLRNTQATTHTDTPVHVLHPNSFPMGPLCAPETCPQPLPPCT